MLIETTGANSRPPDWLPRSIVSGFVATFAMTVAFFIAYALARVATHIELAPRRGAATFTDWLAALTNNPVLDLAANSLFVSGTLHLAVGVAWAVVYAYAFEPRLPGDGWLRGATFSIVPWILSVLVFLPLMGGGWAGLTLGAGPLPAVGNLILHLIYGGALGVVYGPLGDIPADTFPRAGAGDDPEVVAGYEMATIKGIGSGAAIGGVIGMVGSLLARPDTLPLGTPPLAFLPVMILLGASFGALLGSMAGLVPRATR